MTLLQVEDQYDGRFNTIVVGSYDRGDRAATVRKPAERATFHDVPTEERLSGE